MPTQHCREKPIRGRLVVAVESLCQWWEATQLLALIISTCKFNQEAGTCCWPRRFSSSTPSSTQALKRQAQIFITAKQAEDRTQGILSSAALCSDAHFQEGFCSPDEQPASSHQDACSVIECKLGFTFWRIRRREKVHLNPPSLTSS